MTIEPHRSTLPATGREEDPIAWEELATQVVHRHGITLAGIGMIAAQLVWKAAVLSHFYFWQDDFVYFDRALEHGLTWQYLTTLQAGHLDPGPFTLSWLLARISLYNWTLVSVVLLVILLASCLALLRLLRTLFGNRPAILIPLVIYLVSPLTVPDLVWWSNGIEGVSLALSARARPRPCASRAQKAHDHRGCLAAGRHAVLREGHSPAIPALRRDFCIPRGLSETHPSGL